MIKVLKYAAIATAMAVLPMTAQAAIVIDDGETVNIGSGSEFLWGIEGTGGAVVETVTFNSLVDPLTSGAVATLGPLTLADFGKVTLTWFSLGINGILGGGDDFLVSTVDAELVDFGPPLGEFGIASLSTTFESPDRLVQQLIVSTTKSQANTAFDVEVSAVPLPASLLLFMSALGGLGLLGRRRKTTAIA